MPPIKAWTADDQPNLSGELIVVAGGNSGIGFQAQASLRTKGHQWCLPEGAFRRREPRLLRIVSAHPQAAIEVRELEIARLESVRSFAQAFRGKHRNMHVLCNNAGV